MDKNETMNKVVQWVGDAAEKVGDFAAKEIPPFITEYLNWKFWEGIVGIGIHFILLGFIALTIFGSVKLVKFLWSKHLQSKYKDWDGEIIIAGIVSGVLSLGLLIGWVCNFPTEKIMDCIQIKIAPKVYLVEKAAEIYKESKK